jgi:hypothetical protein
MNVRVSALSMMLVLSSSLVAFGQEPEETVAEEGMIDAEAADETAPDERTVAEPTEVATTAAPPASATVASSANGDDGARFRFAVAGGPGMMFGDGFSFGYGGVDLRFGAQINDMIGIYLQPQLGGYGGNAGASVGAGGLVGASAVVDFTFVDRLFVGAGFGAAVLNNPAGPELHLRLGGYPVVTRSSEKVRRKGLMLGVDFRMHFLNGLTVIAPTVNLGYEAF